MNEQEFEKQQAALVAADEIADKFEKEFRSNKSFRITGTSLGHPQGSIPTVRVFVETAHAKQLLTEELKRRDNSHDFPFFEGAEIVLVVTGRLDLLQGNETF